MGRRGTGSGERVNEVEVDGGPVRWWRQWLWPSPLAWMGLAAIWVLLLIVQLTPPARQRRIALAPPPAALPVEQERSILEQRRELARLLDLPVQPAPVRGPAPAGPRSDLSAEPRA